MAYMGPGPLQLTPRGWLCRLWEEPEGPAPQAQEQWG